MTRGTICVTRKCNGEDLAMPLVNQLSYREWTGCWSVI